MKQLDETAFVRHKLYRSKERAWKRYASFVIGRPSLRALLSYELRVALFGSMPGALGLALRGRFYRTLFGRIGKGVVIGRNVVIRHGANIEIGDNVVLDDGCLLDGRGAGEDGLRIGDNTIVGRSVIVQSKVGPIQIGPNCNIGTGTVITAQGGGVQIGAWAQLAGGCKISGGLFKLDLSMKSGVPFSRYSNGPIRIGDCCILGGNVQVTDAVSIGKYSVIGAGAIVMNDVPEQSVFMPRPGMIIGRSLDEPKASAESGGASSGL
jgi:serine acetyltransferase